MVSYFVIWFGLGYWLERWHREYDGTLGEKVLARLQGLSGAGLILYALTVSFCVFDLVMSLEPKWFSTIYGVLYMVSFPLTALAFVIIFGSLLRNWHRMNGIYIGKRHYDLGNLLFGINLFWVYVSLSQFLIIWSGNLQEETPWYLARTAGDWGILSLVIVMFHFVIPFLVLLLRKVKESFMALSCVAVLILLVRVFDLFWQVKPALYEGVEIHWGDLASFVLISGLWLGCFLRSTMSGTLSCERDVQSHIAQVKE